MRDDLLNGNGFVNCQFENCELIFRGKEPVDFGKNAFNGTVWQFYDGAGDTITLLKMLWADAAFGRNVVRQAIGIS